MAAATLEDYKKALDVLFLKTITRSTCLVRSRFKKGGEYEFDVCQGLKGNILDVVDAGTKEEVISRLAKLHDKLSKKGGNNGPGHNAE